ncbi:MAG TPA: phytanoyl-CoA dioxygenase family protein [Abditibacteriaceae bacterium]
MKLTSEQVQAFREEGVVVVENVVTNEDLAPLIGAYEKWIDNRARELQTKGEISELHEEAPFEKRIGLLYEQTPHITDGLDIMQARLPEMFEFLRNESLLDAVESLIGPEITCSPIQHIRAKPPAKASGTGAGFFNVPWHQDSGVTWDEADNSEIVTCWMALVDATIENGCMEVLPGAWKKGHLTHQAEGGTTIRPDLMPEIQPRPVPVKKGGVVFMHRHTPHRSTPNFSDHVRWSLDMRFQPAGTPTGRPFHPDFIARSKANPQSVLTDWQTWDQLWAEALAKPSPGAHRVK